MLEPYVLFFGLKTQALFDVWSIEHVLTGISVGHVIKKRNAVELGKLFEATGHTHHSWYFALSGILCFAYIWETVEHYLEAGVAGYAIEYWFQGVEFWGNRIVTDPLLLVVGYYVAHRYPQAIYPARAFSLCWLFVHIFIFPDSMYLQHFFPSF